MDKWIRHIEVRLPTRAFYSEDIDIEFNVKAGGQETAAEAEITLWNLAPDTRAQLVKDVPIQVVAGYQEDYGGIFLGKIDTVYQARDGADTKTVITGLDALQELRDAQRVVIIRPSGAPYPAAIREACTSAGIATGTIQDPGIKIEQSLTLEGPPATVLQEIADRVNGTLIRLNGMAYYEENPNELWQAVISNNMVHFTPKSAPGGESVLVTSETGLQEVQPAKDETGETDYKITTMLEHRVALDSTIVLQSATATGDFRVVKITHQGSLDGDYTSEIEVKAL